MHVVFRHAWMQKHPTPGNRRGDFHWYPGELPSAIRGTLTELATRQRGQKASLWIVDGSYLAWARTFSAMSPVDQRRYTGLAATIARPDSGTEARTWSQSLPEVLSRLPLPVAAPLDGDEPEPLEVHLHAPPGQDRPLAVDPDSVLRLFAPGDRNLAMALCLGGAVESREPHAERLPALFGRLLSWLPAAERSLPRTGVVTERPVPWSAPADSGLDNLLHYLTAVWFCPPVIRQRWPEYARECWELVFDLSSDGAGSLASLFSDLTRVARAWNTAEDLYRHVVERGTLSADEIASCDAEAPSPLSSPSIADAGWLWNRLLHYWGRGFLPAASRDRLAELLARRIAADHLFHLDSPDHTALPNRYVRRLRYEALLTRDRVTAMLDAVTRRMPGLTASLAHDPEVHRV